MMKVWIYVIIFQITALILILKQTVSDKPSYTSGSENDEEDLIRANNTKSNGRAVGSSPKCIRKRLANRIQKNLKNTIY